MQQAWAQVKSKEPLNKRASLLASSGKSNVQDHMQRQPTSRASEQLQRQQSANHPDMQNSGRDGSNPQPSAGDAGHAVLPSSSTGAAVSEHMGFGQMSGSFNGGQTGPGQLSGAVSSGALLQSANGVQMPYPGQGEPFPPLSIPCSSCLLMVDHLIMHDLVMCITHK